jgi:hypothetical protein
MHRVCSHFSYIREKTLLNRKWLNTRLNNRFRGLRSALTFLRGNDHKETTKGGDML